MKDSVFSTKDIVKYLIVAGLVYTILKMIPSVQMNNKDLILVLAVITIGFVMIDCTIFNKTKDEVEIIKFLEDLVFKSIEK